MILNPEIAEQLQCAMRTHNLILEHYPKGKYANTLRNQIFLALSDISIEHFGGIIVLIRAGQQQGTALALLRPLVETVFRSIWLLYIASDDEIMAIAKEEKTFPPLSKLIKRIPKFFEEQGGPSDVLALTQAFVNQLHGFTHSGVEQLMGRFDGDSKLVASYKPALIVRLLDQAARYAVMSAIIRLQHIDGTEDDPAQASTVLIETFLLSCATSFNSPRP